jgi:hypothetical protein
LLKQKFSLLIPFSTNTFPENYIMQEQNFKNHTRLVPGFHFITGSMLLVLLVGAIINVFSVPNEQHYTAALLCLVPFILIGIFWYTRTFALKAQDRAIRAEENLRHFALTGKLLPENLRLGQIIALRFAADEEFVALVARAVEEGMAPKSIKEAIKNWKADWNRV